jgi:hypothetical protein
LTHINRWINNLQNKDRSIITHAHEDSSMDAPIPNMLVSSSSKANPSIGAIA